MADKDTTLVHHDKALLSDGLEIFAFMEKLPPEVRGELLPYLGKGFEIRTLYAVPIKVFYMFMQDGEHLHCFQANNMERFEANQIIAKVQTIDIWNIEVFIEQVRIAIGKRQLN